MNEELITFRSITAAMQGERVLRAADISCTLLRTPPALRQYGCGYALRLTRHANTAAELLRRNDVVFRRRYRRTSGGAWTEVTP